VSLEGKTAVVTGGSRGIGRAIVTRLARDGANVVFNYLSRVDAAEEVVREAKRAGGGEVRPVRLDLAEPGAAEDLMAFCEERFGAADILVGNATLSFAPAPIAEIPDDLFDRAMAANVRSAFVLIRHAARTMPDNGRIITLSSLNTTRPAPGNAPYVASKGAIEQLTLVAAQELGVRGITANVVSPGATDTDLLRGTNPAEALEQVARITPLRRLGAPADIADVVAFLAGPDSRWITGQNITVSGGLT
jgi:3-oxoacyl-[acyl-carrier protein] reductase